MEWFDSSALTLAVFLPLAGAVAVALLPRARDALIRGAALAATLPALLVGAAMVARFDYGAGAVMQFEVQRSWIPSVGATYHLGVDGIGLPLLVLSLLLSFLCVVYSWRVLPEPRNPKAFLALLLLLETGMNGTFAALDLVLFFVFWELVLLPMYFLIAVWGGARRDYASIKFILYTLIGSVIMLLGFLALWLRSSPDAAGRTFDILALQELGAAARFGGAFGTVVFAAVALGFAVKVPVWPFHTWLPDAHTEAPTVGSVLLAGILLKMGTYGFVRIALPVLPDAARTWAPVIGVLGAIAIIYGALCCLAQRDVKRLIAYSSVGHMGFVMLGIATLTPAGINAAVFGMVAHGVITGMLFFLAGAMHERYHTRDIVELGGGMATLMPRLAGVFTLTCIASLGLPGLAGFWGEILALLAAWNPAPGLSVPLFRTLAAVGLLGTLLTAGYFLWLLQRVNLGRAPDRWGGRPLGDIAAIEVAAWSPLVVLTVALGFAPGLVLWMTNPSVSGWFTDLFA
ncbi:MAG TPA: NADH-quinone oxidoreductase subunit M [Actinomycetota bacterium]|nr:NADH-quinone oxidoreductase subunit M [Actinomycetota bacterium]